MSVRSAFRRRDPRRRVSDQQRKDSITCVDVFCGVGGLSYGLGKAGIRVLAGIDLDPNCRFPFERNIGAVFVETDIAQLSAKRASALYTKHSLRLLAGCAPCQPFSTYTQGASLKSKRTWHLLSEFGRLVRGLLPELVTMENVPGLARESVFEDFVSVLLAHRYHVAHGVLDSAAFDVPQHRERLVLVASRLGEIDVPKARKTSAKTVRQTIGHLSMVHAGEGAKDDALHLAARLSLLNLKRIQHSRPGGTWRDWPSSLIAKCHRRDTGSKYQGVYGRMEWDRPAPTITTLCHGFGNGRFGHPEQDRAITLREAALLQSFPHRYEFVADREPVRLKALGKLIGNAVPPLLAKAIGESLVSHAEAHA